MEGVCNGDSINKEMGSGELSDVRWHVVAIIGLSKVSNIGWCVVDREIVHPFIKTLMSGHLDLCVVLMSHQRMLCVANGTQPRKIPFWEFKCSSVAQCPGGCTWT